MDLRGLFWLGCQVAVAFWAGLPRLAFHFWLFYPPISSSSAYFFPPPSMLML
jgi:hypothetical protein